MTQTETRTEAKIREVASGIYQLFLPLPDAAEHCQCLSCQGRR